MGERGISYTGGLLCSSQCGNDLVAARTLKPFKNESFS